MNEHDYGRRSIPAAAPAPALQRRPLELGKWWWWVSAVIIESRKTIRGLEEINNGNSGGGGDVKRIKNRGLMVDRKGVLPEEANCREPAASHGQYAVLRKSCQSSSKYISYPFRVSMSFQNFYPIPWTFLLQGKIKERKSRTEGEMNWTGKLTTPWKWMLAMRSRVNKIVHPTRGWWSDLAGADGDRKN